MTEVYRKNQTLIFPVHTFYVIFAYTYGVLYGTMYVV
jgi:hypothetical protein